MGLESKVLLTCLNILREKECIRIHNHMHVCVYPVCGYLCVQFVSYGRDEWSFLEPVSEEEISV